MNKRRVEALIPVALEALENPKCGIQNNGVIESGYRSQISSFGAAVTMGSFKAAVAFFSKKASNRENEKSQVDRSKLLCAMYYIVHYSVNGTAEANDGNWKDAEEIAKEILMLSDVSIIKESFINASLALKLALNAYSLV
jgi:hypothetical protein